jgi:hypothetical protein
MNRPHIVFALLLAYSGAAAAVTVDEVKLKLLIAMDWRTAPSALVKWCAKPDPEGVAGRTKNLSDWEQRNADLIRTIDAKFDALAPRVFPVVPGVDAAQAVRAQLLIRTTRRAFFTLSAEQETTLCKSFASPMLRMWSDQEALPAIEALSFVEAHAAEVLGQAP